MTQDPHDQWSRVRQEEPVRWDEQQKAWLISTYADVVAGLTDPRLSSDRINPLLAVLKEERRATVAPMLSVMRDWMVVTDPPTHTRLRKLANAAFRQQRIANMKAWIGEIVDDILDEFVSERGSDFVAGVAYPMPASVIGRMIGAPSGDRDIFNGGATNWPWLCSAQAARTVPIGTAEPSRACWRCRNTFAVSSPIAELLPATT